MKRWGPIVAFLTLIAAGAHADDSSTWKRRGDEAMDAGRAAEALDAYRKAAAIAPSPSLDYNVGRALLATGDFVAALAAFERYEATASEELKTKTRRLSDVMAELRAKISTVEVIGEPGARVLVDGRPVCTLPCSPMPHNPGAIELRVEAEDRQPWIDRRELLPGSSSRIEAALVALPVVGQLSIVVRPAAAKARITLDGTVVGTAPLTIALPPGSHDLGLDAPAYEPRHSTFVLGRSESRRIDVDLTPQKPALTTRWWFWAGLGALAVGAGAVAIGLTVERSPKEGSLGTVHVP